MDNFSCMSETVNEAAPLGRRMLWNGLLSPGSPRSVSARYQLLFPAWAFVWPSAVFWFGAATSLRCRWWWWTAWGKATRRSAVDRRTCACREPHPSPLTWMNVLGLLEPRPDDLLANTRIPLLVSPVLQQSNRSGTAVGICCPPSQLSGKDDVIDTHKLPVADPVIVADGETFARPARRWRDGWTRTPSWCSDRGRRSGQQTRSHYRRCIPGARVPGRGRPKHWIETVRLRRERGQGSD